MQPLIKSKVNPILKPATQSWERHHDIIFPSVVDVQDKIERPQSRYYMYFSLHDVPGGIGLALADSLEGPWRKYEKNPILWRASESKYAHIASSDVCWLHAKHVFAMYYHGLNEWSRQKASQTTGVAFSTDGISWEKHDEPLIDADGSDWDNHELSYARISQLKETDFRMVYMARDKQLCAPRLGLARSTDGITWIKDPQPLLSPSVDTQEALSSGQLVTIDDRLFLFYVDEAKNARNSTISARYSETDGKTWSKPLKLLKPGNAFSWDKERVHDPFVVMEQEWLYLYYSGGPRRGSNGIGLAKIPVKDFTSQMLSIT